jgi:hypothetical protein
LRRPSIHIEAPRHRDARRGARSRWRVSSTSSTPRSARVCSLPHLTSEKTPHGPRPT